MRQSNLRLQVFGIGVLLALSSVGAHAGQLCDGKETGRCDFGHGGAGGGNLEMYSNTYSGRNGELRFVYGGGDYGEIRFIHYTGSSWIPKTVIDKNGHWGIGTEAPCSDCMLAVDGKIRAKQIVVDSGWSDYVFKPGYRLRPLEEVDAYIQQHGHLPGLPTEKEVAQHGIDVAEMNTKLLEKLEELTLYVIELKRGNEHLQKAVAALESRERLASTRAE